MILIKFLLLLAAALAVSGCGRQAAINIRQPELTDDAAVVYIYRPASMSNIVVSPQLSVSGEQPFVIKNDSYTFVQLKPGAHQVRLQLAPRYQGVHQLEMVLQPGEIVYLRVDTQMKFRKNDLYERRFDLQQVAAESAIAEIVSCEFFSLYAHQPPAVISDEALPEKVPEEAEFSISKSRNPFSHKR